MHNQNDTRSQPDSSYQEKSRSEDGQIGNENSEDIRSNNKTQPGQ